MRKDMCKLFADGPMCPDHYQASARKRYHQRTRAEELPQRESIKRPWYGFEKCRIWNRKPLMKFLYSAVGRKWDEVYCEICEHNCADNYVQYRLREVARDHVHTNVIIINDRPHTADGLRLFQGDLWVDPRDGVLRLMPEEPKRGCRKSGRYSSPH